MYAMPALPVIDGWSNSQVVEKGKSLTSGIPSICRSAECSENVSRTARDEGCSHLNLVIIEPIPRVMLATYLWFSLQNDEVG